MNAGTNNSGKGYALGSVIEVRAQFEETDVNGVASFIEPTAVACTFTEAGSAEPTTYTYGTSPTENATKVTNDDSEPVYLFRYTPTGTGRVTYRIVATGTGAAATTVECYVRN